MVEYKNVTGGSTTSGHRSVTGDGWKRKKGQQSEVQQEGTKLLLGSELQVRGHGSVMSGKKGTRKCKSGRKRGYVEVKGIHV